MARFFKVPISPVYDFGYKLPEEAILSELYWKRKKQDEAETDLDAITATTFKSLDKDKAATDAKRAEWKQREEQLAQMFMQDPAKAAQELSKEKRQRIRELQSPGELAYEAQTRWANAQALQEQTDKLKDKTPLEQWYNVDRQMSALDPLTKGPDGKWSGKGFSGVEDIPDIDKNLLEELDRLNPNIKESVQWTPSLDKYGNPAGYSFIVTDASKGITPEYISSTIQSIMQKPEYSRAIQIRQMYEDELESSNYGSKDEYQAKYLDKKHDEYIDYAGQLKHQLKGILTKEERDQINKELEQLKSVESEILSADPKVRESRFNQERYNDIVSKYTNSNQKLFSYTELTRQIQPLKDETEALNGTKQKIAADLQTVFPSGGTTEVLEKTVDMISKSNDEQQAQINQSKIQLEKYDTDLKSSLGLEPEFMKNEDGTDILDNDDNPVIKFKPPVQQVMLGAFEIMNSPTDPNNVKKEVEDYIVSQGGKPFSTIENTDPKDGLTWKQFQISAKDYTLTNQALSDNQADVMNRESQMKALRTKSNIADSQFWTDIYNGKTPSKISQDGQANKFGSVTPIVNKDERQFLSEYYNINTPEEFAKFMTDNPVLTNEKLLAINKSLADKGVTKSIIDNPTVTNWKSYIPLANGTQTVETYLNGLKTLSNVTNKEAIKTLPKGANLTDIRYASNPWSSEKNKSAVALADERLKDVFKRSAGLLSNIYTVTGVSAEEYLQSEGLKGEKGINWSTINLSPVVSPTTGSPSILLSYVEKGATGDANAGTMNRLEFAVSDPAIVEIIQDFATEMITTGESDPIEGTQELQAGQALLGHLTFAKKMESSSWANLDAGVEITIGEIPNNGQTVSIKHDENGYWDIMLTGLNEQGKPEKVSIYDTQGTEGLNVTKDKYELFSQLGKIVWQSNKPVQAPATLEEAVAQTPVTKDLPDFSGYVQSPTAQVFKEEIIDPGYTYEYGAKGEKKSIDCSGAVCKVLKRFGIDRGNPLINNSAQHFYNETTPIDESEAEDGDIITFKTEGTKVDHIGLIVIDQATGQKFIADSSRSYGKGKIVPYTQRIEFLKQKAKEEGNSFDYSVRRLK